MGSLGHMSLVHEFQTCEGSQWNFPQHLGAEERAEVVGNTFMDACTVLSVPWQSLAAVNTGVRKEVGCIAFSRYWLLLLPTPRAQLGGQKEHTIGGSQEDRLYRCTQWGAVCR